jgi:hypothetical protein
MSEIVRDITPIENMSKDTWKKKKHVYFSI